MVKFNIFLTIAIIVSAACLVNTVSSQNGKTQNVEPAPKLKTNHKLQEGSVEKVTLFDSHSKGDVKKKKTREEILESYRNKRKTIATKPTERTLRIAKEKAKRQREKITRNKQKYQAKKSEEQRQQQLLQQQYVYNRNYYETVIRPQQEKAANEAWEKYKDLSQLDYQNKMLQIERDRNRMIRYKLWTQGIYYPSRTYYGIQPYGIDLRTR